MISIIILNFNTFELSCECISSIIKHTSGVEYEIILVDNGSVECSPDLFKSRFLQIILIKNEKNLGFAKGINKALQYSKGKFVLLLNSDTVFTCNVLPECLNHINNNLNIGALTTRIIYPNGSPQPVIHKFPSIKREFLEIIRIHKLFPKKNILLGEFYDYSNPISGDWIWGTFFFTRKAIIDNLTGAKLPEDFFMYFEDVQWGFTYNDNNFKMSYAPLGDVIHYCSSSSDSNEIKNKTKIISNNEKLYLTERYGKIYVAILYIFRALKYLSVRDFNHFMFFLKLSY